MATTDRFGWAKSGRTAAYLYAAAMWWLVPAPAAAVMGASIVTFVQTNIVGPLAVLMILITIGAALFKPEFAKTAGYVAIVTAVLFLLMTQYGNVVSALSGSGL